MKRSRDEDSPTRGYDGSDKRQRNIHAVPSRTKTETAATLKPRNNPTTTFSFSIPTAPTTVDNLNTQQLEAKAFIDKMIKLFALSKEPQHSLMLLLTKVPAEELTVGYLCSAITIHEYRYNSSSREPSQMCQLLLELLRETCKLKRDQTMSQFLQQWLQPSIESLFKLLQKEQTTQDNIQEYHMRLGTVGASVSSTIALHNAFVELYKLFINMDGIKSENVNESYFNKQLVGYTWMLIIMTLETAKVASMYRNSEAAKSICFGVIYFISLNTQKYTMKTVKDVWPNLVKPGTEIPEADMSLWWGDKIDLIQNIQPQYAGFFNTEKVKHVQDMCTELENRGLMKNTSITTSPSGFKIYEEAFDAEYQAYYTANVSGTSKFLGTIWHSKNYDFDPLILQPLDLESTDGINRKTKPQACYKSSRAILKPSLSTKRNIGGSLLKASRKNTITIATPLTVKTVLRAKPTESIADLDAARAKLLETNGIESNDPLKYKHLYSNIMKEQELTTVFEKLAAMAKGFIGHFLSGRNKTENRTLFVDNTLKVFNRLLVTVVTQHWTRFITFTPAEVLQNPDFVNNLLYICAETVRIVYNIKEVSYDEIKRSIPVRLLEISLTIELVLQSLGDWMTKYMISMLAEKCEHILGLEVWQDQESYDFILTRQIVDSKLYHLYDQISLPCQVHALSTESKLEYIKKDHSIRMHQHIIHKVKVLYQKRLGFLIQMLPVCKATIEKAKSFFDIILANENLWRLLYKRGIDIVLICNTYASIKFGMTDFRFSKILETYSQQPQYTRQTLENVPLKQDKRGNIRDFYDQVFVHSVRDSFTDLNSQSKSVPSLLTPIKKPIFKREDQNGSLMTPRTSFLMTDSPIRGGSASPRGSSISPRNYISTKLRRNILFSGSPSNRSAPST